MGEEKIWMDSHPYSHETIFTLGAPHEEVQSP